MSRRAIHIASGIGVLLTSLIYAHVVHHAIIVHRHEFSPGSLIVWSSSLLQLESFPFSERSCFSPAGAIQSQIDQQRGDRHSRADCVASASGRGSLWLNRSAKLGCALSKRDGNDDTAACRDSLASD
jgi:hypothetical protein